MDEHSDSLYRPHKEFAQPADPSVSLWRYCDIAKLISLLDKRALYFALAATLEDQYEGGLPKVLLPREGIIRGGRLDPRTDWDYHEWLIEQHERARYTTFINCWHMNDVESPAMWNLYSHMNQGIAIRSTFSSLTESLRRDADHARVEAVYVGLVKYIDYATEGFQGETEFAPYLHKRKSFDYEREIRAVCRVGANLEWVNHRAPLEMARIHQRGMLVACDLDTLIEEIYISPLAPQYFIEVVQAVCERFGLHKPVKQSSIPGSPPYVNPGFRSLQAVLNKTT